MRTTFLRATLVDPATAGSSSYVGGAGIYNIICRLLSGFSCPLAVSCYFMTSNKRLSFIKESALSIEHHVSLP